MLEVDAAELYAKIHYVNGEDIRFVRFYRRYVFAMTIWIAILMTLWGILACVQELGPPLHI
jgi:hypothetical protein